MRRARQCINIGAAWISLMELAIGAERDFHRWYADDHFYAGGMNLPGIFSGRRWVATRDLQAIRYPGNSTVASPITSGGFLHTNFFAEDSTDVVASSLGDIIAALSHAGRMYVNEIPRKHVFSRIQPYLGVVC